MFTRVLGHVLPAAAEKVNPKYFGRSKQHVERLKDTNFWIWLNCGIEFKVCPKNGVETKGVEC